MNAVPSLKRWIARHNSLRTQLILGNIVALALLLALLGFVIRYTVSSFLLSSIDRQLEARVAHEVHPPPPPPDGPHGFPDDFRGGLQGRPPDRHRPDGSPSDGPPPGKRFTPPAPNGEGFRGPDAPPDDPELRGPGGPHGGNGGPFPQDGPPHDEGPNRAQRFDLQGRAQGPMGTQTLWDRNGFARAQQGETLFTDVTLNDEPYRVLSAPQRDHGTITGVIQAGYPLTEAYTALSGLNSALLTLIPVGLVAAGFLGAILTNRVLRRVRLMTYAAGRIGAQDLKERLPIAGSDEFAELATTFNGLLGRLESAFSRQERLLEQQRRFTADASHELKTPLTIIKGTTSMALHGAVAEPDPRVQQSLLEIDRAADTMSHLVQDLLLLARSDGGQLGKDRTELLVRELLERARSGISRRDGACIELNLPDETLSVVGNEMELVRLFTNLLDNAVRYTPAEGRVTVTARQEGNRGVITVADTGEGIAPEHLAHLGERFYRVDTSRARSAGGTGLGLSICKGIVEANSGTMTFQSTLGVGTTVTVIMPAA